MAATRSAEALFGIGAISQYLGAAVAFSIFDEIGVVPVVWLRVASAAVVLLVLRSGIPTTDHLSTFVMFGLALGGMNLCIYLAIERLPLGNAVAIEFLGPVAVAAVGSRSRKGAAALALAVLGVFLVADISGDGSVTGVGLALAAAALWAAYIVIGKRVAATGAGGDGLTVALVVAAISLAPVALLARPETASWSPAVVALAVLAGLLSSVIPYSIDQTILTRITQARFALLQAMLPVTAVLVGLIALGQVPSAAEVVGILLVAVAIVIRTERPERSSMEAR